ncbi:MAG: NAD(P)/FAD-dependent oxidoreductase [Myxococcota bacterium]
MIPSDPSSLAPIQVGIVGAGPAGLTTALALEAYTSPARCQITIVERNRSAIDYPGVEYGIQARACRALDRIGIKERALHRGLRAHEIRFFNSRLGKAFRPIQSDPDNTRCVIRQEFLADMAALLRRTRFIRQRRVTRYEILPDDAVRLVSDANEEGTPPEFDVVIACDGSFSAARRQFFPESATKTDRGFSCIYMLVEPKDFRDTSEEYLALANGGSSEIIMGQLCTLTLFPMGKDRLAYGIGFDHSTKQALWSAQGLDPETVWADLSAAQKEAIARALVQDASGGKAVYQDALDHIMDWDSYTIYLWKMQDTDPLVRPFPSSGNVLLIGDAAHALMPTIGMGASLAIEDAEAVGRRLADHVGASGTAEAFRRTVRGAVFAPIARDRVPIWQELVRRARLAAQENFIDVGSKRRFAIGPAIPNDTLSRVVSAAEGVLRRLNR